MRSSRVKSKKGCHMIAEYDSDFQDELTVVWGQTEKGEFQ